MSLRRAALEILACVVTGVVTGVILMIAWRGAPASLELAHTLMRYCYEGLPLSP